MISHDRAQELISARMDVPLTPAEHRELQGHLATCTSCRVFVAQADDLSRGLQGMPLLPPSPIVSRGVMAAISTEDSGWGWLRNALQALSSPGMAVASSMALVVALAGALILALNLPGSNGSEDGTGTVAEGTIAAVAIAPLPTEIPTEAAPPPTEAPDQEPQEVAAQPTATRPAGRTVAPAPTKPAETPAPRPTATSVPIQPVVAQTDPIVELPPIEQASGEEPVYDAAAEDPTLAMAGEGVEDAAPQAELAQEAAEPVVEEQPVEQAPVEDEPVEVASAPEAADDGQGNSNTNGRKGNGSKESTEDVEAEPLPTYPVGPVPIEAIAALEGAGENAPDIYLPPAPIDPQQPDQSFLPETPTPEGEGTPTPEGEPASESEAPQLAEDWSGELGVTDLAPEPPEVAEVPDETTVESEKVKDREKRDKSDKAGKSHEQQQAAFQAEPLGWSSEPIQLMQAVVEPPVSSSTTGEPVDPALAGVATTGETTVAATVEPERQIDPATGMEIDPATGYLIDPTTGYLLDVVNNRIIEPRTGYQVHPMTGLLIDPATGALLDPNTLVVVIPPGFGDDQPAYQPGSDAMRGQIETVVDDTYNNASIKMLPPTDGPVQPVGEIVVPTESGDAVEIS
jgi:hypothetical protein